MNKSDLIDAIAKKAGLTKVQAKSALDAYHEAVSSTLAEGNRVDILGFGNFSITAKSARTGRNPRTGETLTIAAKKVVKFKPGKDLSAKI